MFSFDHRERSNPVAWLILRRMRRPIIVLIVAYAISVLGLTLIPGVDANGNPRSVDFLHALYVISYTATTIGFGELPFAFTEAQRLWMMVCIYLTVISWLYSIGALIALVRDEALQEARVAGRFARAVARMSEPFNVVCGYGESGTRLVDALTDFYVPVVVLDIDPARINELALNEQDYRMYVPGLRADAAETRHLVQAGVRHPLCRRVIANTGDDRVNLKIAITAKLLNPKATVIARAEHAEIAGNMASFATDHILDPFALFTEALTLAWRTPAAYQLQDWLLGPPGSAYQAPGTPPPGTWILCGYGRFGRRLNASLTALGLSTVVIEPDTDLPDMPPGCIVAPGTEAPALEQAGVRAAAGIIAGSDDDVNNLSIIMTARTLNPGLFVVARQNQATNRALFEALGADLTMNPRQVLATHIRALVTAPMLYRYLGRVAAQAAAQADDLLAGLHATVHGDRVPDVWSVHIDADEAPALAWALQEGGHTLRVSDLLVDPYAPARRLSCIALMLETRAGCVLGPAPDTRLGAGDRLLLCGHPPAYGHMQVTCKNHYVLHRLLTGETLPRGTVLRRLRTGR